MTTADAPWPARRELTARGKELRRGCPRSAHADWTPPTDRADPLVLLEESNHGRIPALIPIRYGRMLLSPFTFFRGAATVMAADLARTPTTGLRVQACGDCHLLNFGGFATPERRILFDLNDFDETLPAPWEWDVKRLATSFVIASQHNGHHDDAARDAAEACVRSYRKRMAEYAALRHLETWYARIGLEHVIDVLRRKSVTRLKKQVAKAATRDVLEDDFPKLVHVAGDRPTIRDHPPLIYHIRRDRPEYEAAVEQALADYRQSLPADRRMLLDRYRHQDHAVKVVGIGSVGTMCAVALLMADEDDPLFLQVKEARRSVLEPYAGASHYAHRGQRVVEGQRLMQTASDLFLGWTDGLDGRHLYVRQLRDMKIKPRVERYSPSVMRTYAKLCGWALARAHARSGQAAVIGGYLGRSDRFERAVADFAVAYADQNARDYEALQRAVRSGRIRAEAEPSETERPR